MKGHGHGGSELGSFDLGVVFLIPLGLATAAYLGGALAEHRRGQRAWPRHRPVLFVLGAASIAITLVGPLADASHTSLPAHMAAHLVVGMLAPLMLACSAPVTLALRTLAVVPARRVARLLNSGPARFLTHPVPAAAINLGSLWAVYATPLGEAMLTSRLAHYFLLAHFLVAGYLFTVSIVPIDPAPHRADFRLRLVVLLLAIAAHSILAKYLYVSPPVGVTVEAGQASGLVMYYGGALIELALLTVFFAQWYTSARPKAAERRAAGLPDAL